MTEPTSLDVHRDASSTVASKAPVDMGVPLRSVMKNERRRRLRSAARSVSGPLAFFVRFVFGGDDGDDDDSD